MEYQPIAVPVRIPHLCYPDARAGRCCWGLHSWLQGLRLCVLTRAKQKCRRLGCCVRNGTKHSWPIYGFGHCLPIFEQHLWHKLDFIETIRLLKHFKQLPIMQVYSGMLFSSSNLIIWALAGLEDMIPGSLDRILVLNPYWSAMYSTMRSIP